MWFRQRRTPPPLPAVAESLAQVLAEVRRIEVQSRRLVTDVLSGGYRSTFRGAGVEFADVREYCEGDDPRDVDWNVTARVGRPFVKRYVEERELTILFALDLSASMDAGIGAWSARQAAARFVALLGLAAITNNDRIGLVAGSGAVQRFVPPKKGAAHVLRVVRDVLLLRGETAATDLAALVATAAGRLRRRTIVFLLSDFLQPPAHWRDFAACGARHDAVAVWLRQRELQAPPAALLQVVDAELGSAASVDFAAAAALAAYRQRIDDWSHRVHAELRRSRFDPIEVDLPVVADLQAIAQPLQRFFRMRELREARR